MSSKVAITRDEVAGHQILIVDDEWAGVPRSQPLIEGTPDEVRQYCLANPRPDHG